MIRKVIERFIISKVSSLLTIKIGTFIDFFVEKSMRVAITTFLCMVIGYQSWSQPSDTIRFQYCEVRTIDVDLVSSAVHIEVDFGDDKSIKRLKDPATGRNRVFKSPVDALNFLGKQGWEVVDARYQDAYPRSRYLLKRRLGVAELK